ncbi:MAG: hypothetical protein A2169_08865 [Deltaproteobacteria bacterium RBG_13_47_9]|nr:MAG: hypothetical protein A2169_08865 [Deltaproteobacteria bacterium RBG_13_47_9]
MNQGYSNASINRELAALKGMFHLAVKNTPLKELKALQKSRPLGCSYVFHHNGKSIRDFRGSWGGASIRAGLWRMDGGEEGNQIKAPTKIFHDFRRTAVRNMLRCGIREKVAMMISGHKTRSVFDRYHIVSDEDLKEAAQKQQAYHEKKEERPERFEQRRGEIIDFPLTRKKGSEGKRNVTIMSHLGKNAGDFFIT